MEAKTEEACASGGGDRTMRYVVTVDQQGLYRYGLEMIYPFDEDEWAFIGQDENALPAMRSFEYRTSTTWSLGLFSF